jgi:hypothetical protein
MVWQTDVRFGEPEEATWHTRMVQTGDVPLAMRREGYSCCVQWGEFLRGS